MSIIGIDFGTSLNKIGCINQNIFKIITNNYKNPSTPSVAFLIHKDRWFFGERAFKLGLNKPGQCVYATKLMLGDIPEEKYKNREKYWKSTNINYQENHVTVIIKVDGEEQRFSPKEIASKILKNLIDISKSDLPPKVSNTVISVPTEFNKSQINDISEAAKLAGLNNIHLIYDPILASIAYLFNMQEDITKSRTILVYNLGASFLNVSILQINNNGNNKITTVFDENVDVRQIDDEVFNYAYKEFNNIYPQKADFLKDPKTKRKLYNFCTEAKVFNSKTDSSEINIEDEDDFSNLTISLTYDKFDEISKNFFEKSMNAVDKVSEEAKVDLKSIDDVFLVGGSTFLIKIREQLKEKTGKDACTYADPREAVALGACIVGLNISLEESSEEDRESIRNTTAYSNNKHFFENLKNFRKFNIQTEFSTDEQGNVIYEEIETQQNLEDFCNFSLGNYSSTCSTNFSSFVEGPSLSPGNSEEMKLHHHKEIPEEEVKPIRDDSISGKLISAKNLPEKNTYAVVSIIKQNYDIKTTKKQQKSEIITNSSDPLYNLEFNYEKVKKGHHLMVEIYAKSENQNESDRLIGKSLISLKDAKDNQTYEDEFPLKKPNKPTVRTNNPKEFVNLDPNATVKLSLTHKIEYK